MGFLGSFLFWYFFYLVGFKGLLGVYYVLGSLLSIFGSFFIEFFILEVGVVIILKFREVKLFF